LKIPELNNDYLLRGLKLVLKTKRGSEGQSKSYSLPHFAGERTGKNDNFSMVIKSSLKTAQHLRNTRKAVLIRFLIS
jgi:hypothetical protein